MHTTALVAYLAAVQSSRALSLARPRLTKRTVLRSGGALPAEFEGLPAAERDEVSDHKLEPAGRGLIVLPSSAAAC